MELALTNPGPADRCESVKVRVPKPNMLLKRLVVSTSLLWMTAMTVSAGSVNGPWDVERIQAAPARIEWAADVEPVGQARGLYFEGEPYQGQRTRVFAWCAIPERNGQELVGLPAVVLVHGGGGKAYAEWAELWAKRGYVAIAMDLAGRGADGERLPDGGPDQGGQEKFDAIRQDVRDVWSYHAVANTMRAVGVLSAMPEVDPDRIGVTGISWGGYLTCIVAALDDRVKVAVPVYGCGNLRHSPWQGLITALGDGFAEAWLEAFDPARYLPQVTIPMLFINGARDPSYPLDIHQTSSSLPTGDVTLSIRPDMLHGHGPGWAPPEIARFIDTILRPDESDVGPLAEAVESRVEGGRFDVAFSSTRPIVRAELYFTTDDGPWPQREWKVRDMQVDAATASAVLPEARPIACFANLIDDRAAIVSTPYVMIDE